MSGFVWLLKEETTRLLKSSLVLYDFVHLAKLFDKKDRNAQQTPSVTHSLPGLRAGSLYVSQTQCTETNYKLKRTEVTSIHQAGSLSSTINRALCSAFMWRKRPSHFSVWPLSALWMRKMQNTETFPSEFFQSLFRQTWWWLLFFFLLTKFQLVKL